MRWFKAQDLGFGGLRAWGPFEGSWLYISGFYRAI